MTKLSQILFYICIKFNLPSQAVAPFPRVLGVDFSFLVVTVRASVLRARPSNPVSPV